MATDKMIGNIVTEILKRLGSVITQHLSMARGAKKEMQKLKDKLEMIQAVIHDAEKKQVTDEAVKLWLKWLKDVAYDADDVLDEFSYEVMHQKANVRLVLSSSSNPFASYLVKLSQKMKDINKRLDEITSNMVKFDLKPTDSCDDYDQDMENRMTTSFVGDIEIVGRDNDKSLIVMILLMTNLSFSSSKNPCPQEKIQVISIVGMGGLGKTTLAQYVYNDDSVNRNFQNKAWICISKHFDIFNILEKFLESITGEKSAGVSNVDVLVRNVHEHIAGRKYLMVLDDVWNENAQDWEKLMSCLSVGAPGSKILVTTRSDHVASIVSGTIPHYKLTGLSNQDCWTIIKYKAFSPGGALETETMTKIGEEIATRCSGLPLAANFLGSLMRLKRKESDWLEIRDNGIFNSPETPNRIIKILKLSYDNLPAHLKQCFSYCCLFPKDWVFYRVNLIQLWIAEGFVQPSSGAGGNQKSLEDIGNDYFLRLLSNSFFQDLEIDPLLDIETFKMHDLVHDLALSVTGDHEATILNSSEMEKYAPDIRRAQVVLNQKAFPNVLKNAEKLRTLFYEEKEKIQLDPISNKHLRVVFPLSFRSLATPSKPFKLKHLRYLDLSSPAADNVHAASIGQLYNLQVMNLKGCKNVQKIIKGIASLKNLRHLDLSYSDVEVFPDSILSLTSLQTLNMRLCNIAALPTDIGSLQQLSTLDVSGTSIQDLPDSITSIYNLRKLEIKDCRRLETLPHNLGALTQLRELDLSYTRVQEWPDSCTSNLTNLEILDLGSYCNFPEDVKNWVRLRSLAYTGETRYAIMPTGMETLTCIRRLAPYIVMKEKGTNKTCSIHQLAALKSLRELDICNLENVRGGTEEARRAKLMDCYYLGKLKLSWKRYYSAGELFVLNSNRNRKLYNDDNEELKFREMHDGMVLEGLQPHPNLEDLTIDGFNGTKFPKWVTGGSSLSSCLPNLVVLELSQCRRCEKIPALGTLPSLRKLEIHHFDSVKRIGNEFYHKQDESSSTRMSTSTLSLFPSLVILRISFLEHLQEWVSPPNVNSFPLLELVQIAFCPLLKSLPDMPKNCSGPTFKVDGCDNLDKGQNVTVSSQDYASGGTLLRESPMVTESVSYVQGQLIIRVPR